jgi:hypothetical protein
MLGGFDVRMDKPSWSVNRWLTGLLRLFRPQIEGLLQRRDERVHAWQRQHPETENVYEDRRLEVISQLPIDIETQVRLLEQRLGD